ncbi:MAG: LysO family transporter, partial [Alistipes sp.]|nr:LysO family transporter [Alistipes sp.]
ETQEEPFYAGREWVFVAIVHGVVVDFSVPFWVSLFCAL